MKIKLARCDINRECLACMNLSCKYAELPQIWINMRKNVATSDKMCNPMLSSISWETYFEECKVVPFGFFGMQMSKIAACTPVENKKVKMHYTKKKKKNLAGVLSNQRLFSKIIFITVHNTAPCIRLSDKFLPVSCCCEG